MAAAQPFQHRGATAATKQKSAKSVKTPDSHFQYVQRIQRIEGKSSTNNRQTINANHLPPPQNKNGEKFAIRRRFWRSQPMSLLRGLQPLLLYFTLYFAL
ncbi:MAG: hypothetical protein K8I30_14930 [Anaerolineae bacterium]|nr:hypothetical protein [Anaerolineae bacterium]